MYQTSWQGIEFSSFSNPSSTSLAGPEFYQAFYEEFFRRYRDWEQLSPTWLKKKERCAGFVLARSGVGSKILSVGCGLGVMEHYMRAQEPRHHLFIQEVAPTAWRWVGPEFTADRKFLGSIPACLPSGIQFDMVFLSAVAYALDDDALVGLLAAIRQFLADAGGECLLISGSVQDMPVTLTDRAISFVKGLKTFAAGVLDVFGWRPRGQFWGWIRSQREYQLLMRRAGYREIEDGFIDPANHAHYWIAGR